MGFKRGYNQNDSESFSESLSNDFSENDDSSNSSLIIIVDNSSEQPNVSKKFKKSN